MRWVAALPRRTGRCLSKRVLIVEDSELNRDLLVQILEGAYELEVAADGETAVRARPRVRPDLILMDIGLPGMSGLDAAREIKRDPRLGSELIIAVSSRVYARRPGAGDRGRLRRVRCEADRRRGAARAPRAAMSGA